MPKLVSVVFLAAVLLPTQTTAACAWILWTKGIFAYEGKDKPLETAWEPTAFDTHQECKVAKARWITRKPKQGETIKQMTDDIISIKSEGMTSVLSAKCLPDTIKPSE